MTPKGQATKEKIDELDFIKILKICASKDTMKKMKKQSADWEKIFTNYTSDWYAKERNTNSYNSIIKRQGTQF